jgi:multiple sugar transport system substrate-binding protein
MNEQDTRAQSGDKTSSVSRRVFLAKGTQAAAGLTAGSALLAATSSAALADHERLRSIAILRKPPVTLTFTIFGASADAITWRKLADLFHSQNQGIKVNVLAFSAPDWSTYFEKVLTLVAGGRPPDIIRIATEGAQLFGAKDLALPLDSFIKRDQHELEDYFNDVSPKLVNVFKYRGKQLALPFEWNNMVIFYNTTLFKKAGITPPGPNWTGNDFVVVAKKLHTSGVYGFNLWAAGTFGIVAWMLAAGGSLYNSDWTRSTATDPANIAAMQFLHDLVWKYKTSPRPGAPDFPLFEAGRVGMIAAGRWPVLTFNQAKFTTYDVQYFPQLSPHRKTIFGVGAHPIYKHSKYPEEAWTFLKFMTTRQALSYVTRLGFSIPSRRSIAYNPKLMVPPHNFRIYYDSLAAAQSVPSPPQFNEVETALNAVYSKMIANEITPAEMMKTLDRQITSILAKQV